LRHTLVRDVFEQQRAVEALSWPPHLLAVAVRLRDKIPCPTSVHGIAVGLGIPNLRKQFLCQWRCGAPRLNLNSPAKAC